MTDYDPGDTLAQVTSNLGVDYDEWKSWEARKKASQARFFELATESLGQAENQAERLATVVVAHDVMGLEDGTEKAIKRAELHNPGWLVDDIRLAPMQADPAVDEYEAILVEDPALKAFTYENSEDGKIYRRGVRKGSAFLDEQYLKELNPKLYEEVVFVTPWGQEIIPPLNTLDESTTARLQDYIFIGKPTVSLLAPKTTKEEE